jgi:hypothetical protein
MAYDKDGVWHEKKLEKLRDLVTGMQSKKEKFYQYRGLASVNGRTANEMELARVAWKDAERAVYDWRP